MTKSRTKIRNAEKTMIDLSLHAGVVCKSAHLLLNCYFSKSQKPKILNTFHKKYTELKIRHKWFFYIFRVFFLSLLDSSFLFAEISAKFQP